MRGHAHFFKGGVYLSGLVDIGLGRGPFRTGSKKSGLAGARPRLNGEAGRVPGTGFPGHELLLMGGVH